MIQFTTSKGEYVALPISKNASAFRIVEPIEDDTNQELYYIRGNDAAKVMIELPQGSWSFLCTTDTITEEIAKGLVPSKQTMSGIIYPHYPLMISEDGYYNKNHWATICDTALSCFKSLKSAYNLSPDKNYAICKKN